MSNAQKRPPDLKLTIINVERGVTAELEEFLLEKRVRFHYMINAREAAGGELLRSLGLSGGYRTACVCVVRAEEAAGFAASATDRFALNRRGNGIVCTLPVSGISTAILEILEKESSERTKSVMESLPKEKKSDYHNSPYSLIVSVINHGFSEILMSAARKAGANGGAVINARYSGIEDSVKFFGVTLQAEKEIVAIAVPSEQKKEIMRAVSQSCGLNTEACGIIISLPVETCSGIDNPLT